MNVSVLVFRFFNCNNPAGDGLSFFYTPLLLSGKRTLYYFTGLKICIDSYTSSISLFAL